METERNSGEHEGMTRATTLTLTALALAMALGACGRKGDLEPPPGMTAEEIAAQEKAEAMNRDCAVDAPLDVGSPLADPIDAAPSGGAESGNPNRMKDDVAPPC
jgi:predicted small lipoprotein YifL